MYQVRAFISDLDGTLLDVRERTAQAHLIALQRAGYKIELEQIRALNRYSLDSRELLSHLNIELSPRDFSRYIRNLQHAFYAGWHFAKIVPGALNALKTIRKKTKVMQLITSRHVMKITQLEVRKFGFDNYFDGVFTRGDLAKDEGVDLIPLLPFVPHRRRLIQLALRDVEPDGQVWVTGDTPGELEAAKSLGCITIGVLSGVAFQEDLAPFAHHILDSIADIGQLI